MRQGKTTKKNMMNALVNLVRVQGAKGSELRDNQKK